MSKELIDRQEVRKLLRGKCVGKYPLSFMVGLFAATDEIEKMPSVDAVEVVHGRWIWISDDIVSCSQCNRNFYSEDDVNAGVTWYYCPKCGAKMDGDRNG